VGGGGGGRKGFGRGSARVECDEGRSRNDERGGRWARHSAPGRRRRAVELWAGLVGPHLSTVESWAGLVGPHLFILLLGWAWASGWRVGT
jgi:hypothetical protein